MASRHIVGRLVAYSDSGGDGSSSASDDDGDQNEHPSESDAVVAGSSSLSPTSATPTASEDTEDDLTALLQKAPTVPYRADMQSASSFLKPPSAALLASLPRGARLSSKRSKAAIAKAGGAAEARSSPDGGQRQQQQQQQPTSKARLLGQRANSTQKKQASNECVHKWCKTRPWLIPINCSKGDVGTRGLKCAICLAADIEGNPFTSEDGMTNMQLAKVQYHETKFKPHMEAARAQTNAHGVEPGQGEAEPEASKAQACAARHSHHTTSLLPRRTYHISRRPSVGPLERAPPALPVDQGARRWSTGGRRR